MLVSLKSEFLNGNDPEKLNLQKEIDYAIRNINERKIYASAVEELQNLSPLSKKKNTSMIDYLNEYSDVNQDKSS